MWKLISRVFLLNRISIEAIGRRSVCEVQRNRDDP